MTAEFGLGEWVSFDRSLYRITLPYSPGSDTVRQWEEAAPFTPREGVVVGWRTLSNGKIVSVTEGDGYGHSIAVANEWHGQHYFRAYLVSYDLRTAPLFVLPSRLTTVNPAGTFVM